MSYKTSPTVQPPFPSTCAYFERYTDGDTCGWKAISYMESVIGIVPDGTVFDGRPMKATITGQTASRPRKASR